MRGDGGDLAGVVGLDAADRDQRVAALGERVGERGTRACGSCCRRRRGRSCSPRAWPRSSAPPRCSSAGRGAGWATGRTGADSGRTRRATRRAPGDTAGGTEGGDGADRTLRCPRMRHTLQARSRSPRMPSAVGRRPTHQHQGALHSRDPLRIRVDPLRERRPARDPPTRRRRRFRGRPARADRSPRPVRRSGPPTVAWSGTTTPTRSSPGDAPDTVNPSLWRQSQLVAMHGLFEVVPGIYQVRGLRPVEHHASSRATPA